MDYGLRLSTDDSRLTTRSVPPTRRVCAGRRSPLHPLRHRRHVPLMHGAAADVVGILRVAGEAVLAALAVDDLHVSRRISYSLEEVLGLVHGVVQIAVVHRAAREVDLP